MLTLPKIDTMELIQIATPFDDSDWLFEVKYDGFRSLAYIENGTCKLVSRNKHDYQRFADLRDALPSEINAKDAILDGELVVLDGSGKARFNDLMANRGTVVFAAFDVMWLDGRDLRDLTLLERKEILRYRLNTPSSRVIFVDHVQARGKALYEQICKMDLDRETVLRARGIRRTTVRDGKKDVAGLLGTYLPMEVESQTEQFC